MFLTGFVRHIHKCHTCSLQMWLKNPTVCVHGSERNSSDGSPDSSSVCVTERRRDVSHCHYRSYGIKHSMIYSPEPPAYSCLLRSISIQNILLALKLYISSLCITCQFLFACRTFHKSMIFLK